MIEKKWEEEKRGRKEGGGKRMEKQGAEMEEGKRTKRKWKRKSRRKGKRK